MFFYNNVPTWLYAAFILISIPFTIYEYNIKTKKEYPNHPLKYMLVPGYAFAIVAIFYRIVHENNFGIIWIKIINVLTGVTGVLFVLGFIYMFYILVKDGYYTPEALDKLKRTVVPLLAIAAVLSLIIFIRLYLR